jgi:hypothetical protein
LFSAASFTFVVTSPKNRLGLESERFSFILDIVPQDEDCKKMFNGVWGRMSLALKTFHENANAGSPPAWTRWKLADWFEQKNVSDRQKFAAWIGPIVVGMLNVRAPFRSPYDSGEELLYIEHVATAPGNIETDLWDRKLEGVGSALMAYAVMQSCVQGYRGRIGLHAQDSTAERFYQSLTQKYQMFYDVPMRDVAGTPEDSRAKERLYFEAPPEKACAFLEGYRNA